MATNLGLALKIFADAGGVVEKLTPVQRAIQQLDKEAASVTAVFDKFGSSSAAAAAQQEKFAIRLQALNESLRAGLTTPDAYVKEFDALGRAAAEAANDLDAASRIIEANLSREERAQRDFATATAELDRLRKQGMLTEEQYAAALQRVSGDYAKATIAADKYEEASGKGGDAGVLKFNELSGVLSALPGPIGNVAGRLSGLASAGEGLSRVFAGGLSQGISGIGASVAGLINPFTAAVAGVAAFGAGATAVARGLADLEDRVERLGNTADKLGVSFEFIQTLEAAAARSGTSIEAVSAAFGRLQRNVTGVDEESKAAQAALQAIGVTSEELAALKPEDQYKLIGERLTAIEDPAKRTAASIQLFGRSGTELLPFFRNLGGAASDMERFGRALTDIDRQRIDDFGAGLDALGVATQGLGQSVLLPFAGLGEGVTTAFAEIIAGITAVVDPIGQVLEPILSQIGRVIELIGTNLGNLGRVIGAVFDPFAVVVQGVSQAFEPLLDGVLDFFKAVSDSAVVITEWAMSFTPIGAIADNVGVLGDTISRVVTIVTTAFSKVGEVIAGTFGSVSETVSSTVSSFAEFTGLGAALQAIGNVISGVFGSVASIFSTIANAIGGTVGRLLTMAENFLGIDRAAETATAGIDGTAESVKELTKDEQKAFDELSKEIGKSDEALNGAIEKASEFGQAGFDAAYEFQQALKELEDQAKDGELNAEQYARGVANATAEYDKQIEYLKQVQEETKRAAEEAQRRVDADKAVSDQLLEQARIDREFGGDSGRAKAAESVLAVEREIARIKEEVAAARDNGDAQAVANGEERIRQLGEIRDEQQSIADGSAKAAEDERKRLDDQRTRVDEMLMAGREQTQLEQDIIAVHEQQLQAQADIASARIAGNQAEADAATARLAQLDQLDAKLKDQQQAIDQGFADGFTSAFAQVDAAIGKSVDKAAEFGNAGAEAAQRLTDGIAAAQQQAADGILNKEAFDAEVKRQQQLFDNEVSRLDELKKKKAKDAADFDKEMQKSQDQEKKSQELYAKDQLKAQDDYAKQQKQSQQQYAQEQAKIFEEQRKAAEAESKRQEERLTALNTLGSRTIKGTDIRTQEGAALVVGLAANAQDPALIAARQQVKYLETIAAGISQAASNYFNSPVAIVGYSSFGAPR